MRTVSFSDRQLQSTLNSRFTATYTNIEGDPSSGKSIAHRPHESPGPCLRGNGKQNVQTIFLTPAGKIFHVATGYQSSDDLKDECQFAINLFARIRASSEEKASSLVRDSHRERILSGRGGNRPVTSEFDHLTRGIFPPGMIANRTRMGLSSGLPGSKILDQITRQSFDADQQFCVDNPMLDWTELERNPEKLVGDGESFFASSGFGTELFSK